MTKRTLRISDRDLIAIEAHLVRLDAEYSKLDRHDDPKLNAHINMIGERISDLEERALGRAPASMLGLAVQARVVARYVSCDSMVDKLIRNIEAMAAMPAPQPGIRLRAGKRYRKRNGQFTAVLDQIDSRGLFFGDSSSGTMYEADGRHIGGDCIGDRAEDLIEEIAPAPRVKKLPSWRPPVEFEHRVAA